MKPFTIVLAINLSFFAIWGLVFVVLMNRPELIPLMTSLQAAINLLCAGIFFLDRQRQIGTAFLWSLLLVIIVTVVGYLVLNKYQGSIGLDEDYTVWLRTAVPALHMG
jgi:hypothetical protein